jgi:hypothetical protein
MRSLIADPAVDGDYSGSIDFDRAQYLSRRSITQDDPLLSIALLDMDFDAHSFFAIQNVRPRDLPGM